MINKEKKQLITESTTPISLYNTENGIFYDKYSDQIHSQRIKSYIWKDSNSLTSKQNESLKFFKLPRRKMLILGYSILSRLFISTSLSVFNPIFPKEAEEKYLSGFDVSASFGILYAVVFVSAPILGQCLVKLGINFVFVSSLYAGAVANFCFAILHYGPGGTLYLMMVLLSRSMLAMSFSASSTVTQAIACFEFQEDLGKANGLLNAGAIFAFVIGPALSGFLDDVGGYVLPFYITGGFILLTAVLVHATLPTIIPNIPSQKQNNSILHLLKNPLQITSLLSILFGMMGLANIDATLTIHLDGLSISMTTIGLVYALLDVLDTFSNFAWGYLTDKYPLECSAISSGFVISSIGYLILGPAPFPEFIPFGLPTVCVAVSLIGLAFGSILIPSLKCMVIAAVEIGYEETDLVMLSNVSGLFTSTFTLGGFLGQFVIGLIGTKYGYDIGYLVISGTHIIVAIIVVGVFCCRRTIRTTGQIG